MPIRPENRARYPKDWKAISKRIRRRAGGACEWCRARGGDHILRGEGSHAGCYMAPTGQVYSEKDGTFLGMARGSEFDGRMVKIVLTVAHLDHQPENNDPENLAALCQKCHLTYDAAHHAENARKTRRARKASGDLFDGG